MRRMIFLNGLFRPLVGVVGCGGGEVGVVVVDAVAGCGVGDVGVGDVVGNVDVVGFEGEGLVSE